MPIVLKLTAKKGKPPRRGIDHYWSIIQNREMADMTFTVNEILAASEADRGDVRDFVKRLLKAGLIECTATRDNGEMVYKATVRQSTTPKVRRDGTVIEGASKQKAIWNAVRGSACQLGFTALDVVAFGTTDSVRLDRASVQAYIQALSRAGYLTSATATIGGGGSVSVAARAAAAGVSGNIEAGIRLVTVTPLPQVSRVTVAAPGFAGGADEESFNDLRNAVLEHIRQRPHGGAAFDYRVWVKRKFDAKAVSVLPGWIGRGSVGVVVAMKDADGEARVPTEDEIEAILDYLGQLGSQTGVRPATAHVVVLACELQAIPVTVRLRPDSTATRAAVTAAYRRFIETIGDEEDDMNFGPIGARIEPSRISEAISAAAGEYAHDLTVPAAPYTLGEKKFPIAADITFLEPL